jgi:hypothetical protein
VCSAAEEENRPPPPHQQIPSHKSRREIQSASPVPTRQLRIHPSPVCSSKLNLCQLRPATAKEFYTQTTLRNPSWFRSPAVATTVGIVEAARILCPGWTTLAWTNRAAYLSIVAAVVWASLGPLPRWVPGPTTRWAPGTTRLALHGT